MYTLHLAGEVFLQAVVCVSRRPLYLLATGPLFSPANSLSLALVKQVANGVGVFLCLLPKRESRKITTAPRPPRGELRVLTNMHTASQGAWLDAAWCSIFPLQ